MIEALQSVDANILLFIQHYVRFPLLDTVMVFITTLGNSGLIWIFIGLLLLIPKSTRRGGLDVLMCILVAFLLNDIVLKELISRLRPYDTVEGLTILVNPLSSYSFPSGHANSSFAAAMALTLAFGKKGAFAYIPAVLISFSRCYVGVHYPSDILAGMIFGTLVSLAVYNILRKYVESDFVQKKRPK